MDAVLPDPREQKILECGLLEPLVQLRGMAYTERHEPLYQTCFLIRTRYHPLTLVRQADVPGFSAARSLEEAVATLSAYGEAAVRLAGGTDLGVLLRRLTVTQGGGFGDCGYPPRGGAVGPVSGRPAGAARRLLRAACFSLDARNPRRNSL